MTPPGNVDLLMVLIEFGSKVSMQGGTWSSARPDYSESMVSQFVNMT